MGPVRRRSVRLPDFDYASPGAFFVTVCTRDRACTLGEVVNEAVEPSPLGQRTVSCWERIPAHFPFVDLDAWVLMPNHLHGILVLHQTAGRGVQPWHRPPGQVLNAPTEPSPFHTETPEMGLISPRPNSLAVIIRTFKGGVTTEARHFGLGNAVWQRGFYEHVIRGEAELSRARDYIVSNPIRWAMDRENPARKR
jgi:putative transposase